MHKKHETITRPELWYCFVSIGLETKTARARSVVPSAVVASYVREEHRLWLDQKPGRKDTDMRTFRRGKDGENYK